MNALPSGPGLSYRLSRCAMRTASALYWRWRVSNAERVPVDGPLIIASNHVSFADPPLLGAAAPRAVHVLARSTLFRPSWFGAYLRSLQAWPLDRDGGGGAGFKKLFELLDDGQAVILFPEGTRSVDGRVQAARAGLGMVVVKSGVRVLPVRIFGAFEAYPKGRRLPRPGRVEVKFGHPLEFSREVREAESASKARLKAIYQEVSDAVMASISRLAPGRELDRFPPG